MDITEIGRGCDFRILQKNKNCRFGDSGMYGGFDTWYIGMMEGVQYCRGLDRGLVGLEDRISQKNASFRFEDSGQIQRMFEHFKESGSLGILIFEKAVVDMIKLGRECVLKTLQKNKKFSFGESGKHGEFEIRHIGMMEGLQ